MIRIVIEESQLKYPEPGSEDNTPMDIWKVTGAITTSSRKMAAGVLRSAADEMDPPGKTYRDA